MANRENDAMRDSGLGNQIKMHAGEIDIDGALVGRLLDEQFPDLAGRTLTAVRSTGTVNALFRLGDDLCVRLPRLAAWADSIQKEWTWLPRLATRLTLRVPRPLALGEPTSEYPCHWAIYAWIEAASYQDEFIDDEHRVASDLANFILELRSIDTLGAPRGGRRPLLELDATTRSAIDAARGEVDMAAALAAWDGRPVWMHADLLKFNLLVRGGRLHAVIDFGSAGIGDPAMDVVPAWSVFGKGGREAFRKALAVDDGTWSRARGYALHQALLIIPYYTKTNPAFASMAKRTLDEILAETS